MNGNKFYREVSKALNHMTKKDILAVRKSIGMSNERNPRLYSIHTKDDWNKSDYSGTNKGNNRWRLQVKMLKYYSIRIQGDDLH